MDFSGLNLVNSRLGCTSGSTFFDCWRLETNCRKTWEEWHKRATGLFCLDTVRNQTKLTFNHRKSDGSVCNLEKPSFIGQNRPKSDRTVRIRTESLRSLNGFKLRWVKPCLRIKPLIPTFFNFKYHYNNIPILSRQKLSVIFTAVSFTIFYIYVSCINHSSTRNRNWTRPN